jgi:hypothetical protein
MQNLHHPLPKRQSDAVPSAPSISGVVGGATAASVGVGSSLLLTSATSTLTVSNPLDPNNPVITLTESSSSSPTSSSLPPASHTSPSVSTGAILGISAGVFVVAVAVMFAVYTHYKKRTYERTRRPPPRGPPPTPRVEDGTRGRSGDKWERLEGDKPPAGVVHPPAPPKTPEIGKLFEKDPSVRSVSDEKASHTFDPATAPNFVKYHPDLVDDHSTVPPSRPFATGAESSQVVSWGGDTVAGSFLSFRTSGSMSPSAAIRQTPMTTDSALHRWESAEVLNMGEPERPGVYSETEVAQDPFRDEGSRGFNDGNEADTRATGSNPFFNASQHNPFSDRSSRSRKSSISTVKRSRSRSNSVASRGTVRAGAGDNALLSLIAALDNNPVPSEDPSIRASMQTTSSVYTQGSMVPPTPKAF